MKKLLALEVLDEKTNVVIVSSILHPDIGALKKAIESNEQRLVSIYKPDVDLSRLEKWTYIFSTNRMLLLIEFTNKFNCENPIHLRFGTYADFNFINSIQKNYVIGTGYPIQKFSLS